MQGEDSQAPMPDVAGLVAMMERLQQDWLRAFGAVGVSAAEDDSGGAAAMPRELSHLSAPLLRAQAAWLEGGLRYMGRLSETNADYLAAMSSRLADVPPEGLDERGRREFNDEVRAYLRRVADISSQEARVLESRLAEVEADLREPPTGEPSAKATRLVRAKD